MIDNSIIQATSSWPYVEARKLVKERKKIFEKKGKITLQTGYGPSGLPHIGTFAEVARTTMIANAIKQVVDIPIISRNCCSWWPLSHFIAFTVYSYIWPQYSVILFLYGVAWEIIEGIINMLVTDKGKHVKHQQTRMGGRVEYVTWWAASYKDVLFNLAGIITGRMIRTYILP